MAMDFIKVEPSCLSGDAENFESIIKQFFNSQEQMINVVQALNAVWSGSAKEAFMTQFQNDCDVLDEVKGILVEMHAAMHYAWEEYQRCNSDVSATVSAIRIG